MKSSHLRQIEKAATDERLSLKAIGLFVHIVKNYPQGVPAAEEIAQHLKEGRDSVQAGLRELVENGYLDRVTYRTKNGTFRRETSISAGQTGDGFARAGEALDLQEDSLSTDPLLTTSDLTISDNTLEAIDLLPSEVDPTRPFGTLGVAQEGLTMTIGGLPEDDETTSPTPAVKARPAWDKRDQRPPAKWNINELVSEFEDRTRKVLPDRTGMSSRLSLTRNISRWKKDGIKPEAIFAGMEMFFGDPRNLNSAGQGKPPWQAFVWFFQTNQIAAAQMAGVEKSAAQVTADKVEESGQLVIVGKRRF